MGSSVDWTRERFTLDDGLSHAVRVVFVQLYEEGLVYRDRYIVNWCPRCRTAISDLETVHQTVKGQLWTIRYPAADGSDGSRVPGRTSAAPCESASANNRWRWIQTLPEHGRRTPS